jgi:3-carboxy-cis,cis-muconate cycloisomerase
MAALARQSALGAGAVLQSATSEFERDGAAWLSEWIALAPVIAAAAASARIGVETLAGLSPDPERMLANLSLSGGGVLAEAASFALAAHMPRPEAQALVKEAARDSRPLLEALQERVAAPVDWASLARWETHLGASGALIDQALSEAAALG